MQGERVLAQHARRQAGVFSRSQVVAANMTRRQIEYRLAQRVWRRSFPGVYRVASAPRSSEQRLWAAVLWAGDDALVSHRSAGVVWRLDEVTAGLPELWVPTLFHKRHDRVMLHRGVLGDCDKRLVAGLRVTSVERTLLDLASVLDGEAIEIAFEAARRDRNVTVASMERCIDRYAKRGRPGVAALRRVLRDVEKRPSESALEVRAARLVRRSRLPRPVQQHVVGRYRLDFAWPDRLVALECDGRDPHARLRAFQPDRTRSSELAMAGWRVLVVTHDDVTRRGDEVVERLRRAL